MQDTTTRKICMLCGESCADRPRIKDPKGRYSCRDCYEQAIARRTQRRVAARSTVPQEVIDEVLEASGSHVAFAMKPCPSCGMPVPDDAVICMRCGFDGRNGRAHQVRVGHRVPAHATRPRFEMRSLFSPFGVAIMVTALFGSLLAMAFVSPSAAMAYGTLQFVFGIVLFIAILIVTFLESVAHGVGLIVIPLVAYLVAIITAPLWGWIVWLLAFLYVCYVVFNVCESQYVRWLFVVDLIFAVVHGVILGAG